MSGTGDVAVLCGAIAVAGLLSEAVSGILNRRHQRKVDAALHRIRGEMRDQAQYDERNESAEGSE